MKHLLPILILFSLTTSCRLYDKVFKGDVVARIGSHLLYESDISALNLKGFSPEDSTMMVRQYIHSWAKNRLLLDMADKQLSKKDRDVEKQLEEYRQQLIIFRYEKQYVEQRLDTVVTEEQYMDYYESNQESFITQSSLIKGVLVKVAVNSPSYNVIKSIYKVDTPEDVNRLEEICYSSADLFYRFDEWVSMEMVAQLMEADAGWCEERLPGSIERTLSGYSYFVGVRDVVAKGSVAPMEYSRGMIKDIILNKRKQELISSLERNLLNDAINSDDLIIYTE